MDITPNTLRIDMFDLSYIIDGNGKNTLVIGSALYYSRTFSNNLKKHLKLVFCDHRGFANATDKYCEKDYTLDKIVDDIEFVRTSLNLGKIILIGHSGHGFMALAYTKKYPKHVSQLVLIGMGINNSDKEFLAAEKYFEDIASPERKSAQRLQLNTLNQDIQKSPENAFITYCVKLGPRTWYDYHFDATDLWRGVSVNMPIIDYLWGKIFREIDITKDAKSINCPILLALGKHDYLVSPYFHWDPIKDKFDNLTLKLFEFSGHTPQLEEAALFDNTLLSWLRSH